MSFRTSACKIADRFFSGNLRMRPAGGGTAYLTCKRVSLYTHVCMCLGAHFLRSAGKAIKAVIKDVCVDQNCCTGFDIYVD